MQATQNLFSADFSAPKPSACPDVIQLRQGSGPGLETALKISGKTPQINYVM